MHLSLVTGGSGFIGQHLVQLLCARGEQVRIFDRRPPAHRGAAANVEFQQGDITDRAAVDRAVTGTRRVYHLAANPNLWAPDKGDFDQINRLGTLNVLAAAERHRPERVVYTSTESIRAGLRGRSDGGMIDESVALRFEDMPGSYCRSKFLAERAALEAAGPGLPVVVVNPTLPVVLGGLCLWRRRPVPGRPGRCPAGAPPHALRQPAGARRARSETAAAAQRPG